MPKSHNKKRNVGIVYELLLRRVSECLVNEEMSEAQKTLDIISKRFKKGTALYKEFRLFRALAKSCVTTEDIARRILSEAKIAAREADIKQLEKEKSDLIREMNYSLKDKNLYFRNIPDYKSLATIQVLLNDWRDGTDADIERMALYESKVVQYLMQEKHAPDLENESEKDLDPLVIKIMSEKINRKYSDRFSKDQKAILKSYAFSATSENKEGLEALIKDISSKSLKSIESLRETTDNQIVMQKIDLVREKIIQESQSEISDQKVVRFLTLIDLCREIKESNNV